MVLHVNYSKKVLSGAALILVAAIAVTVTAFAAIPHSSTKVISACRDNTTGNLKVIDVENSGTCSGSETSLTWSGARNAVAAFDYVTNDPYGPGSFNSSRSRNVAAHKMEEATNYGSVHCISLDFTAKYIGNGTATVYTLTDPDSEIVDLVSNTCGTGYDYLLVNAANTAVFFTE